MAEKYIELNLNDEKAGKVAEILANKTAKKILGLLAEKELSETDISNELRIPLNTIGYNIKKLVEAGLIEKSKAFFWSVKGKKIPTYRLSNKKIIISTKNSFKSLALSGILGGVALGAAKLWMNTRIFNAPLQASAENLPPMPDMAYAAAPKAGEAVSYIIQTNIWSNVWIWILAGVAVGAIAYIILKKVNRMKGGLKKI